MSLGRSFCGTKYALDRVRCVAWIGFDSGLPKLSFVLMAVGVGLIARRLPAAKDASRHWRRRLPELSDG